MATGLWNTHASLSTAINQLYHIQRYSNSLSSPLWRFLWTSASNLHHAYMPECAEWVAAKQKWLTSQAHVQLSIMPSQVAILLAFPTCSPPRECLHYFAWRCLCCVSARFAPDGCNQRVQRHPLPTLWAPAKHSWRGCHWTDVCWPAQLLVAGACHLARPCFISTSVTLWKKTTCHGW